MTIIAEGEFDEGIGNKITELLKGKTIKRVLDYSKLDSHLVFLFTDGTTLDIQYDLIYDWKLVDKDGIKK